MNFKKILITGPTSANKHYCFPEWLDHALRINYPGEWKIVLFDNTVDNGESAKFQNDYYKKHYAGDKFECIQSDNRGQEGVIARICNSHNDCRKYALDNNYDSILHLETDVMVNPHFLQELVIHKKAVVGALYYRDFGSFRKLMVQQRVNRSPSNVFMYNFDKNDDLSFVDGTLKQVGHIGLGCLLIDTKVLKKIPFRFVKNVGLHPDSYFAEDIWKAGIKIFADTLLIAEHRNQDWEQVYTKTNTK